VTLRRDLPPKPENVSPSVHEAANAVDDGDTLENMFAELKAADYAHAELPCDLVLKGGVTSGIVYPTAICRLARDFHFKRIGGTSVGALAAAAAAAAEVGRRSTAGGFPGLAGMAEFLSSGDNLRQLFQPAKTLRPLFHVFLAAVKGNSVGSWLFAVFLTALGRFWVASVTVVLVTAGSVWSLAWFGGDSFYVRLAIVESVAIGIAVLIIGLALRTTVYVTKKLPKNEFGLCSGSRAGTGEDAPKRAPDAPEATAPLIEWLADRLNAYAGRELVSRGAPALTFYDLWNGTGEPHDVPPEQRNVDLAMMTTNVTLGRPHRIPFHDGECFAFYFTTGEFEEIFPAHIVDQMTSASKEALPLDSGHPESSRLHAFPAAHDLPLIVAARMSMSFPLLFRPIPVHVRDLTKNDAGANPIVRCLFSDGGLTSNMPLHFFDGPVPRWPTFAIDLRGVPDELAHRDPPPAQPELAFMANAHSQDHADVREDAGGIVSFVLAIVDTIRTWNDAVMLRVPGYRERTVQIVLSGVEGGLNLEMDEATRKLLVRRGDRAGTVIDRRFSGGGQNNGSWIEQRTIRAHSFLAMAEQLARDYTVERTHGFGDGPSEEKIIATLPDAAQALATALGPAFAMASPDERIGCGAPTPYPELRTRPRV
jgi:hypothetical protein